jgi:hypothetical protein
VGSRLTELFVRVIEGKIRGGHPREDDGSKYEPYEKR